MFTDLKRILLHKRSLGFLTSVCAVVLSAPPIVAQGVQSERAARRIIATTSLAAKEYAVGVSDGNVVLPEEVNEAKLFLTQARQSASELAHDVTPASLSLIDSLIALVNNTASPSRVTEVAQHLESLVREAFGGLRDEIPALRTPVSRGENLYARQCSQCHGELGAGDGISAASLNPPPSDLTDQVALWDQSPLDFFRKITIGVSGTGMPAFEGTLSESDRWAVAWFATRLRGRANAEDGAAILEDRCPNCRTELNGTAVGLSRLPGTLADPVEAARQTDEQLFEQTRRGLGDGSGGLDSAEATAVVAYLRTLPFAEDDRGARLNPFGLVRTELSRAARQATLRNPNDASNRLVDAYVAFEAVEADVAIRNKQLATRIEASFSELRGRVADEDQQRFQQIHALLLDQLTRAEATLTDNTSGSGLFMQSFVLLLREGIEAILIVGVLTTVLARSGSRDRRRNIWWGVWAAIGTSLLTAVLIETVFRIGVAEQEALEGITMLLAAGVLVFVGHWLIAKVEVNRWKTFVATQARRASSSGSALAMGGAAFLAVYREGFETVLFYKALFISAGGAGGPSIALGAMAAAVCLATFYIAINRFGVRVPLRPFFAVTSVALLYLAFTFAGQGVAELQGSDLLRTTFIDWWPSLPSLGLYPTMQSIVLQATIAFLVAAGLFWTFVVQPRRLA